MGPQPPLRLVRAAVFSAVCGSLTLVAHVTSSHVPVPLWSVMVGFAMVFGVTAALAGHERSPATILGGLLGGQFALHVLFSAAQPHAAVIVQHDYDPAGMSQAAMGRMAGQAVSAAPMGPTGVSMTLAHVVAAAVSAWFLWRGERAAWALARRVAALARWSIRWVLASPRTVPATGPVRIRPYDVPHPVCAVLRHAVVLRGPPRCSQVSSGALSA